MTRTVPEQPVARADTVVKIETKLAEKLRRIAGWRRIHQAAYLSDIARDTIERDYAQCVQEEMDQLKAELAKKGPKKGGK
jgi:hypothetical protein